MSLSRLSRHSPKVKPFLLLFPSTCACSVYSFPLPYIFVAVLVAMLVPLLVIHLVALIITCFAMLLVRLLVIRHKQRKKSGERNKEERKTCTEHLCLYFVLPSFFMPKFLKNGIPTRLILDTPQIHYIVRKASYALFKMAPSMMSNVSGVYCGMCVAVFQCSGSALRFFLVREQ